MPRFNLFKLAVFTALALPALLLMIRFVRHDLGIEPVETLLNETGQWALRALLLTLAMTPLRRILQKAWPLRLRRMLGLYSFFYALLHFLIYVVLDRGLYWDDIVDDILERPYIMFGFVALLLLLPLAITSTQNWMRRLGRDWQRLHRAVYVIAVLALLHFYLLVKIDVTEPLIYSLLFLILMLLRIRKRKS